MPAIQKVGVIGAGVMGAGIAAHVANAGVPAVLLDIVPADAKDRSVVAKTALAKLEKAKPAAFMKTAAARLVTPGNVEDDLDKLADCDWIIEAVTERLDIKHAIYTKIGAHRKPGSIVSSNTSTIPVSMLTDGMGDGFAADFLVTHFFNPPRYMPLLELVAGPTTRADALESIADFCDQRLGKGVVRCNDRPGFIGNRLGVFWALTAVSAAFELGLTVEEADAVMGRPIGVPKTGVFGMTDLVGLDLLPLVAKSLGDALEADDPFQALLSPQPLMERMIADGYTGRKGKGGFYRINRAAGKQKEAIDLETGAYRPSIAPDIPVLKTARGDLRALIEDDSKYGRYAWRVLSDTLVYAASLIGDATDRVDVIDEAMRLGYNWQYGPFQLMDRIGVSVLVERLQAEGRPAPAALLAANGRSFYRVESGERQVLCAEGYQGLPQPKDVLLLEDVKLASEPVLASQAASLWDIGDGVACFEITTRMNALNRDVLAALDESLDRVGRDFRALVIYSDEPNFSVGADLRGMASSLQDPAVIEEIVTYGQTVFTRMRDTSFPVVAAVAGMALGGGCELALHANAVQAHAECYMGLVEVGVGLVPAWGGCSEMLYRLGTSRGMPRGPMPAAVKAFETISMARVSSSAAEAMEMCFLRPTDGVTMNRIRLLADAKAKALSLVDGFAPIEPASYHLPGPSGEALMVSVAEGMARMGLASAHDVTICGRLAHILTGGGGDVIELTSKQQVMALEKAAFLALLQEPKTMERISHMIETGKPLRN